MKNFKEINRTFTVKKTKFFNRVMGVAFLLLTMFSANVRGEVETVIISEIASINSWSNGVVQSGWTSGGDLTYSQTGNGNNGKYYTSDNTWRFYSGGSAVITPKSGYTIVDVTSYPVKAWTIDAYGVASVAGAVNIRCITVTYKATSANDCNTIDVTGGSPVILPAGSTTYSTRDWAYAGAPVAYGTEATKAIGPNSYCVTFTQAYDDNNPTGTAFPNGIQLKASAGAITISNIVSTYGIDVEFVCSGTSSSTFSVALTGATTKTGQSGTVTISTETSPATLTISKNTSNAGYVKYIKISPREPSCDEVVTIGTPSITGGGTVTFSSGGSSVSAGDEVEACDDDVEITAKVTPAFGYYCSALSFSGGSVVVSPTPGAGNYPAYSSHQDYTLSFTQHTNATLSTSATFTAKTLNSISLSPSSAEVYVGQYVTFDVTYNPSDYITKGYSFLSTPVYVTKLTAGVSATTQLRLEGGRSSGPGASITTDQTETVSIKATGDNTKTASVTITVKPLPLVHFTDVIHGYVFADIVGTIEDNVLVANKTTPTHADFSGSGANDCETDHTRLVGWIEKTWADAHPDASHSDIIGAGTGVFIEANAAINVLTYNGNTYYAVWAKLE